METAEQYLQAHPEVKLLISIFTAECVHCQPSSIREFARSFFANREMQAFVANSFGFADVQAHIKAQINYQLERLNATVHLRKIDEEQARMVYIVGKLRSELGGLNAVENSNLAELMASDGVPITPHEQALRLSTLLREKETNALSAISTSNLLLNVSMPSDLPMIDANDEGASNKIAAGIDVYAHLYMSSTKVKLVQLAEFAHKSVDFTKFRDLGNAFLIFPPLKDQLSEFLNISTRPLLQTAFPRALTIYAANSLEYKLYGYNIQLFYCHVHGVGFLEVMFGLEPLLQRFPAALFVCTNWVGKKQNCPTELKYFAGIGKNMRYLCSGNNCFGPRLFAYLPVVLKGNYKNYQVEDFCVVFVSFVPVCHFQNYFCFYQKSFYQEKHSDEDADSEVSYLDVGEFVEMPELLPLNAKTYDSIIDDTVDDLRAAGVNIARENVRFANISTQRLSNFDQQDYPIMHTLFEPLPRYDNPNWEFWFDMIVNSMDNRGIENYDQAKIEYTRCFKASLQRHVFSQVVSFKNMVIDGDRICAHVLSQQEIKDISYIEPLMYYIDYCMKLNCGIGMIYEAHPMQQFRLLTGRYFRRLTVGINHDPVLTYIANVLHAYLYKKRRMELAEFAAYREGQCRVVYFFSQHCLVGHGPLFDCADLYHSLDCRYYCYCSRRNLAVSQYYFGDITYENVLNILTGLRTHGKVLVARTALSVLLKALVFHCQYNIMNQTFSAHSVSFPYIVGVGLCYNFNEPEKSFLFDYQMYRSKILASFQYQNVNGNLLSNVFLHQQLYQAPYIDAAVTARLQEHEMRQNAVVILDHGCFEMCQVAHALRRFGVVLYQPLDDLKVVVLEDLAEGETAQSDVDVCYPCSIVTTPEAYQHVYLLCRSVEVRDFGK